jgi:hypothetical protein
MIAMSDFEVIPQRQWDGVMPGNHQASTLDNFDYDQQNRGHVLFGRAAARLVDQWQGDDFVGLYIHGEPGTGKSHAAVALGKALVSTGSEVHYRFVPDLEHQQTEVYGWTAPRTFDGHYYSYGGERIAVSEEVQQEDGKKITTVKQVETPINQKSVERNRSSVFPSHFDEGIERNPKTVLVLDDYKPRWRQHVRAAIEAASNAGGLVIITSNFPNVDGLTVPTADETRHHGFIGSYGEPTPEQQIALREARAELDIMQKAMLSRVANGILSIEFTGQDQRKQQSFWADMITPEDFA